jgi:bifunctional DNA-binding transcriptional regulator/antitoxin component of YhaV-PrlF toxin-antitoxin module
MQQNAMRSGNVLERKIISVSLKRQLTIPQKYFESLGFNNEAECILQKDGLLIRPLRDTNSSEFAEQILADLISQGYAGQELLEKFKQYSKAIRPAVQKMIEEAEEYVRSGKGRIPMDELFGTEE